MTDHQTPNVGVKKCSMCQCDAARRFPGYPLMDIALEQKLHIVFGHDEEEKSVFIGEFEAKIPANTPFGFLTEANGSIIFVIGDSKKLFTPKHQRGRIIIICDNCSTAATAATAVNAERAEK
jgi:hypothetical protein